MGKITWESRFKPEKVAGQDPAGLGQALTRVSPIDDKWVFATNGRAAAIIPAVVDRAPYESWKGMHADLEDIKCWRREFGKTLADVEVNTSASEIASPDILAVRPWGDDYFDFSIDVRELVKLAEAIDAGGKVTLRLRGNSEAAEVRAYVPREPEHRQAYGLLMPMAPKKRQPARRARNRSADALDKKEDE